MEVLLSLAGKNGTKENIRRTSAFQIHVLQLVKLDGLGGGVVVPGENPSQSFEKAPAEVDWMRYWYESFRAIHPCF